MTTAHPITDRLLSWYADHARNLPWRAAPEAYSTWLSEVILQQTRVDTGTAYWHRFLAEFPTVQDLAAASPEQVMALWKGLGYYSRARNLHAAAQHVVNELHGELPHSSEGWRQLPGIGPYTAAAIASICFSEPVPVVDGNVQRVLSRLFDIANPVDRKAGKAAIDAAAAELVHPKRPGDSNQAWMELGALVCTPKNPKCGDCPLVQDCQARATGTVSERPVKSAKKAAVEMQVTFHVTMRHSANGELQWWVERRPDSGIWGGLESFPVHMEEGRRAPNRLDLWGPVRHILTHRKMTAWFSFEMTDGPNPSGTGAWLPVSDDSRTWPRLIAKVIAELQAEAGLRAVKN
ncbi:MAG: A/G-specific adenine glycosylase [Crocinitomicaceae bacterium TMED114]|nr:MAG: A/G-specific adenine glycosylase [Crocinitomicaceae bacterium TMED114]